MVQQVSIVFTVPGLVLMLLGTQFLRALVLPLSYLIFMIPPFFDLLIQKIHWPLQLFSAVTASKMLSLLTIPVFQRANFLVLPSTTLEVAEACSGVRYLISIIALGIPLAYVTQRTWIRRVLLIAAGLIIGVIINPLRITLIALWAYHGGQILHGPLHIFQGLFVSVIGFILLFVLAWGFAKIPYRLAEEPRNINSSVGVRPDIELKQFNLAWLAAVIMLFCFAGFVHLYKPVPVPLRSSIAGMPLTVGDWRGEELSDGMKPFKIAGADYELSRIYRNASGHEIRLQIVYFETQRKKDKELINYKLDDLYRNSEKITIPVSTHDNVQINKAVMRNGTDDSLVLYWYDLNGRIVADNYKGKLFTALDGLFHRRTNGAMIVVSSTLANPEAKDTVMNQNVVFIRKIFPLLTSLFQ
jgi:EpsI family protein